MQNIRCACEYAFYFSKLRNSLAVNCVLVLLIYVDMFPKDARSFCMKFNNVISTKIIIRKMKPHKAPVDDKMI